MPNNMDSAFLSAIKEMLRCCKEIQLLLRNDKDYFSKNQLTHVDNSNQKKAELLHQLNSLTTQLSSDHQSASMWNKLQQTQQDLLQELKTEILACYQYLMVNSGIVFANLQQLKDIWDKLLACKPKEPIYDRNGVIEE